jgi:hypothetical protein
MPASCRRARRIHPRSASTSSIRATYSPSTFGMHHIFSRHGLSTISLSRRRIVSVETVSCAVSRTISSARSCNVHRARPEGGAEQVTAINRDSSVTSSFRCAPGRGASLSARSSVLDEALLHPIHGRRSDGDVPRDFLVRRALVSRQQDLRSLQPAGGSRSAEDHRNELNSLGRVESYAIPDVHGGSFSEPLIKSAAVRPAPSSQPGSLRSRGSTSRSSTCTRSSTDDRQPRPTCSGSSRSHHLASTTWWSSSSGAGSFGESRARRAASRSRSRRPNYPRSNRSKPLCPATSARRTSGILLLWVRSVSASDRGS